MTYFYGQSLRKKAAILPTKPHTRLHLNHVVMTPVAQEHCGEPHVGVITFFPVKIPARHEEKRERWKRFSICQRLPRPLNRLPRFVFVSISPGRIRPAQHDVARSGRFTLVPLNVVLESVRFGGLIATGSHGSGWNSRTLSDLVSSIEIVTASGHLRTFEMGVDHDDILNAARLNLGLFGIIYRMTLTVQKTWNVRALDRRVPVEQVLENLQEWVLTHDSLDLFWWPFSDQFWVKS